MTNEEFKEKYSKPEYIGDSVYIHFDGCHIVLETRNGLPTDPSNTIGMEPKVLDKFEAFRKMLKRDIYLLNPGE